jgi:hypothetical protein
MLQDLEWQIEMLWLGYQGGNTLIGDTLIGESGNTLIGERRIAHQNYNTASASTFLVYYGILIALHLKLHN